MALQCCLRTGLLPVARSVAFHFNRGHVAPLPFENWQVKEASTSKKISPSPSIDAQQDIASMEMQQVEQ